MCGNISNNWTSMQRSCAISQTLTLEREAPKDGGYICSVRIVLLMATTDCTDTGWNSKLQNI